MTREQLIKHWDVIKAFKEGKEIQCRPIGNKIWLDNDNEFEFALHFEYREKPEQKRIIELSDDGETWFEATRFIPKCEKLYARVRVEKKPTKRLPTIEEVEKWFMRNRVFVFKEMQIIQRIEAIDKNSNENVYVGHDWISIEEFCELYTHYDGSELYITED